MNDIMKCIGETNNVFSKLQRHLWNEQGVRLQTKIYVYHAIVITTLYGCVIWTIY